MDTTDGAIEADIKLDGEALQQEVRRRKESRGQRAVGIAKPGIHLGGYPEDQHEHAVDEDSPLLPRGDDEGEDGRDEEQTWSEANEFAYLPWHKRPHILWVLAPFFLMACAFGGIIAPKVNLILELVCRQYLSERVILDPGFTYIPVDFNDGNNDQCRIPEVQSRVTLLMLWGSLLAGSLSAITAPKLGALSDRYGRRMILIVTSIGTIGGEIITICAATYPESFPVNLLLLGFAIDGMTGSFIVAMAIANAYAADCVPPSRRNVAFGYFHGCLFTGIAVGPIIAGYVVKATGRIVTIFWILLGVHVFFMLFVGLVVPESLSKKRQMIAREKNRDAHSGSGNPTDFVEKLRAINPLEPLKILWPTGPGSSAALRWNLVLLAAVDTIAFGVAMGAMTIIISYTNYMFGWQSFESGRYLTIVNTSRVFCLIVILPALTRYVRGKPDEARKATGSDHFDLGVIRFALLFDTLGFVGYSLARSGIVMTLAGTVAAVGGIGSPTLQSSLTKHIPAGQTGQLLGATGLLHALARVVAPTVFSAIYAGTVKTFPQAVFVCLASTFGLAFLISWLLKTNSEQLLQPTV